MNLCKNVMVMREDGGNSVFEVEVLGVLHEIEHAHDKGID